MNEYCTIHLRFYLSEFQLIFLEFIHCFMFLKMSLWDNEQYLSILTQYEYEIFLPLHKSLQTWKEESCFKNTSPSNWNNMSTNSTFESEEIWWCFYRFLSYNYCYTLQINAKPFTNPTDDSWSSSWIRDWLTFNSCHSFRTKETSAPKITWPKGHDINGYPTRIWYTVNPIYDSALILYDKRNFAI